MSVVVGVVGKGMVREIANPKSTILGHADSAFNLDLVMCVSLLGVCPLVSCTWHRLQSLICATHRGTLCVTCCNSLANPTHQENLHTHIMNHLVGGFPPAAPTLPGYS